MFKASKYGSKDMLEKEKSIIGRYLTRIGIELSDLIEINGILVVRSKFWNKGSNDMHGFYSLGPYEENCGCVIHVQAYSGFSRDDPSNPLIAAHVRMAPESFNGTHGTADNRPILETLLGQDNYGSNSAQVARLIADRYNEYVKRLSSRTVCER